MNRAKIPERNQVGFGNVPWTDEGKQKGGKERIIEIINTQVIFIKFLFCLFVILHK